MLPRPLHILASVLAAVALVLLLLRSLSATTAYSLPRDADLPAIVISPTTGIQTERIGTTADSLDVIIQLEASADLQVIARQSDKQARRRQVVTLLQDIAAATQPSVVQELVRLRSEGLVHSFQPFWIFSGFAATLTPDALPYLQNFPGVEQIIADRQFNAFGLPPDDDGQWSAQSSFAGWAALPEVRPGEAANWSVENVRAPQVWHLLDLNGEGVTVAIVDTGVDWQHPALRHNYRGGSGAAAHHAGNWFSAVQPTQTVPLDLHGHGTHVAGTAVGGLGIGVAPGAKWIAAAIADEFGRIRDSDIHAAFQWLLAPGGRPELAPDVVNNSWGTAGDYTAYRQDINALEAAGIVTVFAAGNTGPNDGTVNAPASYPGVISVAAVDYLGAPTWFSSRGPSPLTSEPKPLLAAPGARVLSAYPNGRYALFNGTSMATPHVSGAAALMLAAEPRLTSSEIAERLAAASGNLTHNTTEGWGELDAFEAVAPLVSTGSLMGAVSSPDGPIMEASITVTTPARNNISLAVTSQGGFALPLIPGTYTVQASAFGFEPLELNDIDIIEGHVTTRNFYLQPEPSGTLTLGLNIHENAVAAGHVTIERAGEPVPANPTVLPDGRYSWTLPTGHYEVIVRIPGYRLAAASVTIGPDEAHSLELPLEPGPRLLLVDSGGWQFRSQAIFYDEALTDLGYFADTWSINNPYGALPTIENLSNYDAVLWTAPYDSPGIVSANDIITDYLGIGGRLLIAGQNVGSLDGAPGSLAVWWARHLDARWLAETTPDSALVGASDTHFAGLSLSLNGEDSARNQESPDQIAPLEHSLSRPLLLYPDGTAAAMIAGRCELFRLLFMGFGLEGVTGRANRAVLMQSILDTLLLPEDSEDAVWQPAHIDDFALAGDSPVYTATLRNLNRELTQTFNIGTAGGDWPRSVLTPTITIAPCDSAETSIAIEVPEDVDADQRHEIRMTAAVRQSGDGSTPTTSLTLSHKTPGTILLVDDDRFQQAESIYHRIMGQAGLEYDVWETGWQNDVRGSPRADFLRAYDLVIWFTGYDWFYPISSEENEAIGSYLASGGRLFLTSQDYLARNGQSHTARHYLGVADFQESITPTHVIAVEGIGLPPSLTASVPLTYGLYQNFSDGLIPDTEAAPFLWHNQGAAAAVAAGGIGARPWRSLFWAFPFEALPTGQQEAAFRSILGQLSDLGDTRFEVDRRTGTTRDEREYVLTVINSDDEARQVWISNTLPFGLEMSGGSTEIVRERPNVLQWQGILEPGQQREFRYTAAVSRSMKPGTRIDNMVTLRSAPVDPGADASSLDHVMLARTATTWVNTPELTSSRLEVRSTTLPGSDSLGRPRPFHVLTYSLVLENSGLLPTGQVSASVSLPQSLGALENTLETTGGMVRLDAWRLLWQGNVAPGKTVTATIALTETAKIVTTYAAAAYIDDRITDPLVRSTIHTPLPHVWFLPIAAGPP